MEDGNGPRPMRDMKPAEKTPNSADKFRQDHQAQYENRGKQTNKVDWVQKHNAAYPKLCDELDKRRCIAQCRPEEGYASNSQEVTCYPVAISRTHYTRNDEGSLNTDSHDTLKTRSSIASMSSYKSYGSIDQEPMVRRR